MHDARHETCACCCSCCFVVLAVLFSLCFFPPFSSPPLPIISLRYTPLAAAFTTASFFLLSLFLFLTVSRPYRWQTKVRQGISRSGRPGMWGSSFFFYAFLLMFLTFRLSVYFSVLFFPHFYSLHVMDRLSRSMPFGWIWWNGLRIAEVEEAQGGCMGGVSKTGMP